MTCTGTQWQATASNNMQCPTRSNISFTLWKSVKVPMLIDWGVTCDRCRICDKWKILEHPQPGTAYRSDARPEAAGLLPWVAPRTSPDAPAKLQENPVIGPAPGFIKKARNDEEQAKVAASTMALQVNPRMSRLAQHICQGG